MAANKFAGFPGGGNMNSMLKQAQKMQEQMLKAQQEVEATVVEASSGGGMVTVKATGKKELLEINIKPEAVDPDDVEMLQDLIMVAVNDALSKAEALSQEKMGALTGGLNIPGLL